MPDPTHHPHVWGSVQNYRAETFFDFFRPIRSTANKKQGLLTNKGTADKFVSSWRMVLWQFVIYWSQFFIIWILQEPIWILKDQHQVQSYRCEFKILFGFFSESTVWSDIGTSVIIGLVMELHLFGYSAPRNHPRNLYLKLLATTSLLI